MALTDIFARRYRDTPLWECFSENERRLLVQVSRIVSEQLFYEIEHGVWGHLNRTLSMELGVTNLSALSGTDPARLSAEQRIHAQDFPRRRELPALHVRSVRPLYPTGQIHQGAS